MDIEVYRNYCLSKKQVTESFPFPSLPDALVFKVADKMFTATNVEKFSVISVQLSNESADEIKAKYLGIKEHKYFKKGNWVVIEMNGSVPDSLLFEIIDVSYNLSVAKLTGKKRNELGL